jgi:hypothetical protein
MHAMIRQRLQALSTSRFGLDVLWNMGSIVFLAVGGILLNSLILALRGEAALGIFNQVFAFYIVLSQIGVGGIQYSALTQISYVQNDQQQVADIALAALLLVLSISLLLVAIAFPLAPIAGELLQSESVTIGLRCVLPGLIFFGLNKVLINILNGLQYMRAYALFRALRYLFLPIFCRRYHLYRCTGRSHCPDPYPLRGSIVYHTDDLHLRMGFASATASAVLAVRPRPFFLWDARCINRRPQRNEHAH